MMQQQQQEEGWAGEAAVTLLPVQAHEGVRTARTASTAAQYMHRPSNHGPACLPCRKCAPALLIGVADRLLQESARVCCTCQHHLLQHTAPALNASLGLFRRQTCTRSGGGGRERPARR